MLIASEEPVRGLADLARVAGIVLWRALKPRSAACRDYVWFTDVPSHDRCPGVLGNRLWRGFPCWDRYHGAIRVSIGLLRADLYHGVVDARCDLCAGRVAHTAEDHRWSVDAAEGRIVRRLHAGPAEA